MTYQMYFCQTQKIFDFPRVFCSFSFFAGNPIWAFPVSDLLALELNFKFNDGLQIVRLYIQIGRYILWVKSGPGREWITTKSLSPFCCRDYKFGIGATISRHPLSRAKGRARQRTRWCYAKYSLPLEFFFSGSQMCVESKTRVRRCYLRNYFLIKWNCVGII